MKNEVTIPYLGATIAIGDYLSIPMWLEVANVKQALTNITMLGSLYNKKTNVSMGDLIEDRSLVSSDKIILINIPSTLSSLLSVNTSYEARVDIVSNSVTRRLINIDLDAIR